MTLFSNKSQLLFMLLHKNKVVKDFPSHIEHRSQDIYKAIRVRFGLAIPMSPEQGSDQLATLLTASDLAKRRSKCFPYGVTETSMAMKFRFFDAIVKNLINLLANEAMDVIRSGQFSVNNLERNLGITERARAGTA